MNKHMGPQAKGLANPISAAGPLHTHSAQPLPPNLSDVALIDASTCAAAGAMSISWWHAEVAAGRAPKPAIRAPRCTRWRLADVHAFWVAFAEKGNTETQAAQAVTAQAKKASAAAKAKRTQLARVGA